MSREAVSEAVYNTVPVALYTVLGLSVLGALVILASLVLGR